MKKLNVINKTNILIICLLLYSSKIIGSRCLPGTTIQIGATTYTTNNIFQITAQQINNNPFIVLNENQQHCLSSSALQAYGSLNATAVPASKIITSFITQMQAVYGSKSITLGAIFQSDTKAYSSIVWNNMTASELSSLILNSPSITSPPADYKVTFNDPECNIGSPGANSLSIVINNWFLMRLFLISGSLSYGIANQQNICNLQYIGWAQYYVKHPY